MKKGKLENASLVRGTGEAGCATLLFHNSISSHGGLSCHQHREGRLCNTAAQQGQYGTQIHGWSVIGKLFNSVPSLEMLESRLCNTTS